MVNNINKWYSFYRAEKIHLFIDDTDKKQIEDKEKVAADTSGLNIDRMELDNEEKDGYFHDALETQGE